MFVVRNLRYLIALRALGSLLRKYQRTTSSRAITEFDTRIVRSQNEFSAVKCLM